ncbi:hypothetical protein D3C87_16510 [compost metagenome]
MFGFSYFFHCQKSKQKGQACTRKLEKPRFISLFHPNSYTLLPNFVLQNPTTELKQGFNHAAFSLFSVLSA